MNAISDFDRELLEAYLDDALSATQVQHVLQRTCEEPELAAAMHELRAQRTLRIAAWRSLEPADAQAAEVARQVNSVVQRVERAKVWRRWAQVGSATAAGLAVFLAGWIIRGTGGPAAPTTGRSPSAINMPTVASATISQVALTDQAGHVLAVQKFERAEEARQFADDLMRFDARRRTPQPAAVFSSDRF